MQVMKHERVLHHSQSRNEWTRSDTKELKHCCFSLRNETRALKDKWSTTASQHMEEPPLREGVIHLPFSLLSVKPALPKVACMASN